MYSVVGELARWHMLPFVHPNKRAQSLGSGRQPPFPAEAWPRRRLLTSPLLVPHRERVDAVGVLGADQSGERCCHGGEAEDLMLPVLHATFGNNP